MASRIKAPLPIRPASAGFGMMSMSSREGSVDERNEFERVTICALSGQRATHLCGARVFEWLTHQEAETLAFDTMHESIRVERSTGLRAGSANGGCPVSLVEERIFERYPPEYQPWAKSAGRPLAPGEYSSTCPKGPGDESPARSSDATLAIVYPHEGASFVIDSERPRSLQALDVLIRSEGAAEIELHVDGRRVGVTTKSRRSISWAIEPGKHELVLVSGATRSLPVGIRVR